MWAAVKTYLTRLNAFRRPTNRRAIFYSNLIFIKTFRNIENI